MESPARSATNLDELIVKFLKSQNEFVFAPYQYSAIDGGWGSGKTQAMCYKALILSHVYPGNLGVIGRFNATDLQDSTMVNFFEVCPRSWIKSYNKSRKWLTFHNGSQIAFRHLNDPNPRRSHIAGMNLGWFGIDQAEECGEEHWHALCGRLRRPEARKKFGFLAANPNGKDWIYEMFFSEPPTHRIGEFAVGYAKGDKLGIAVRSEENKKSNGGFVDDAYYDGLRQNMPPEWVARFLDCSFEDFSGKIYKEFTLDSIHNVEPFEIPAHWGTCVGIDVGGDSPWGIPVGRIDEIGNIVWTHEFYEHTVNSRTVVDWIKNTTPQWNGPDNLYVIDPENKLAMLELGEAGLYCRPAHKGQNSVRPGIIRCGGYLHVNSTLPLPGWYTDTQSQHRLLKFAKRGSPRMFFFSSLKHMRKEMDTYHWDPDKPNKPKKEHDHLVDAMRYVVMQRPHPSTLKRVDAKREALRRVDPGTASMWDSYDKRVEARIKRKQGRTWTSTELFGETERGTDAGPERAGEDLPEQGLGIYDWHDNGGQ